MFDISQIISDLEIMKQSPNMFINPVTPEMASCYLTGFERGVLNTVKFLTFSEFIDASKEAYQVRGWRNRSISAFHEMSEKGIAEDNIIRELIEIEIEKYRILSKTMNQIS